METPKMMCHLWG